MTTQNKRKSDDEQETVNDQDHGPESHRLDIQNLETDHADLKSKLNKIHTFMLTQEYGNLDQQERERIQGQKMAMDHYYEILTARIQYHKKRLGT